MDRVSVMWNDLAGRIRALWEGPNRNLAVGAISIVAFAVVLLGALYLFNRPQYEPLFSNLSASDAANVTQHLKDDKVPYQLSADGKTVFVPSQNISDERVAIAGANLIKGGSTGYELFDRTNFGMTEFEEKIDKTRAIEGELERTISGLDPVEGARVQIAAPDQTLYTTTQNPTTASVAVTTKPGMQLSPEQVQGITMLVSHAVEGLKPENVTIVNQDGQVLLPPQGADSNQPDPLNLTQEQLAAKQRYEATVQSSVQSMLDQTLGPRRAVARVSTKMNFDANSTETKTYAPQGTVLSTQSKRESYNGQQAAARAAGVPGTTTNIPTYQGQQQTPGGKYNKSENTTNYDISESNTKHIDAPGKVESTSVAVVLNSAAVPATTSGTPAKNPAQPYQITPAMRQQIQNLVVAAAGLNLANGDQVSVESIPFNPAVATEPNITVTQVPGTMLGIPLSVVIAILVLGALGGLGMFAMRARRRTFKPAMELPSFDSTLAEELPPFEEHPMLDGAPGIAAPIRSAADLTREQMIEYVTTVAQENPDSIAKLVKLWLAE
ncbi:MAG TPA: flagellar basal-body MS-ring/collar protein FliF [Candidatus Baltobacteraceae bacterium]|nr:flagellar basal-body MS-ring/collar protein FliF [Candidatus Baltobacteraceae bacterium]